MNSSFFLTVNFTSISILIVLYCADGYYIELYVNKFCSFFSSYSEEMSLPIVKKRWNFFISSYCVRQYPNPFAPFNLIKYKTKMFFNGEVL